MPGGEWPLGRPRATISRPPVARRYSPWPSDVIHIAWLSTHVGCAAKTMGVVKLAGLTQVPEDWRHKTRPAAVKISRLTRNTISSHQPLSDQHSFIKVWHTSTNQHLPPALHLTAASQPSFPPAATKLFDMPQYGQAYQGRRARQMLKHSRNKLSMTVCSHPIPSRPQNKD